MQPESDVAPMEFDCAVREARFSTPGVMCFLVARRLALLAVVLGGAWGSPRLHADPAPIRWLHVPVNLLVEERFLEVMDVIEQAAQAGCNGLVLSDPKLSMLELQGLDGRYSEYRLHVQAVQDACDRREIELIPVVKTASRATAVLAHNANLAAGYEVRNAEFVVRGGKAHHVPDPGAVVGDGGFEVVQGNRFSSWSPQDGPGVVTFAATRGMRSGTHCLRLHPGGDTRHGMARVRQRLGVIPRRCYRLTAWVRTEGLEAPGRFNILVHGLGAEGRRDLAFNHFDLRPTQRWTQVEVVFNSFDYAEVEVYVGVWRGKSGDVFVDDVQISEIALVNVLRRDGCPLTVRTGDGQTVLIEGQDYAPVSDPQLGMARWPGSFERYHAPPVIDLRPDYPEEAKLLVSFYHPLVVGAHQVDACLSAPEVLDLFERQVRRLDGLLGGRPRRFFLSCDEMRTGGGCARCKASGLTAGELLAEQTRRLIAIIRKVRPGAEVVVWSDMFDPNHNAHDGYYLMESTLAGSWEGLSDQTLVMVWDHARRDRSIRFFAGRGHRVIGSIGIDAARDVGRFFADWSQSIGATPAGIGLMYTSWSRDYRHLGGMAWMTQP